MSKSSKLFIRLNDMIGTDFDITNNIDLTLLSDYWQWSNSVGAGFRISVIDKYESLFATFATSTSADIYYREEDVDGVTDTKVWSGYVDKTTLTRLNYELQFDVVDKFEDLRNETVDYATIGTDTDNEDYKTAQYIELTTALKSAMRDKTYTFDWEYPTNTASLHRVMFANDFGREKIVDIFYSKTLNYTVIATQFSIWTLKYTEGEDSMYGGAWMLKKIYTSTLPIYKLVYTFQGEAIHHSGSYDYVYIETQSEPTGLLNEKHCEYIIRLRYDASTFAFKDAPAMFATDNTDPDTAVPYASGGKYIVSGTPVLQWSTGDNEVMICLIKKDTARDLSKFRAFFNSDYSNGIWQRTALQSVNAYTIIPFNVEVDSKWVIIEVDYNGSHKLYNATDFTDITAGYTLTGFSNMTGLNKIVSMWHSNGVDRVLYFNDPKTTALYTVAISGTIITATKKTAGINDENYGLLTNAGWSRLTTVQRFSDGTASVVTTDIETNEKFPSIDYALPFLTYVNTNNCKFNLLFHSTSNDNLFVTLYGTDSRLYITDNAGVQNGSIFDLITNYAKPAGIVVRYNLTSDSWEFVNYDYASTLHTLDDNLVDRGNIITSYYQTDYKNEFAIKTPYRLISKNGYGKKVIYTVSMDGDWQGLFTALATYFTTRRTQYEIICSGFLEYQVFDRVSWNSVNYRVKSVYHKVDMTNNATMLVLEAI